MNRFLFLFASFLLFGNLQAHTVITDQSDLKIETPTLSERKVQKLRLDNGLEAILISDPKTRESGAALAVGVGSWDDPKERAGMAHFVEHMLFLGTKKYPQEESYCRYLDEHGGSRNAFTMADRTVYMFSVNNDGFLGALDRFGQFFIDPLFSPSGVNRESKAIHQEFCKDIPLDPWRVLYVKKELANKKHPFHDFSIGNMDTLAKISQDELKAWYKSHYSANLMRLVVYSSADLKTLEKEVVSIFSSVKNLDIKRHQSEESLFASDYMAKMIAIAPVQDIQILELSWELPRIFGVDKDSHSDKLVAHILGHEGPTSLLAQLKKENLAEGIASGTSRAGSDQCLFSLKIQLTSKGVKEYEKVIQKSFEAIQTVKECGIPRYIYDEIKNLEETRFRFQSRQDIFDLVSDYAMELIDEPLETFPRKTLIPTAYSPEKIETFLATLTPQNCQFTLVAEPTLANFTPTFSEKWLGVNYTICPLSDKKMEEWSSLKGSKEFALPQPNPYIPEKFSHAQANNSHSLDLPKSILIEDSRLAQVYLTQDDRFSSPEICWIFRLKTPLISEKDPASEVMADLYCHAVDQELNQAIYDAQVAGLSYSLNPKHDWIELKISGFGDKAPCFLQTILTAMKNVHFTKEQFAYYRELYKREYFNHENSTPLKQGAELLTKVLYNAYPSIQEKSKKIDSLTFVKMARFSRDVFKTCYVEGLLYGHLEKEEGEKIWKIVSDTLAFSPYLKEKHPKLELATLNEEKEPAILVQESTQPANAVILTTDCGPFSFKKRASHEILTKGLEEPFFHELRTRQQTAYVVSNWSQELERHLYSFFAIQSSSHDSRDLLSRFELFLESSLNHLSENVIPEERFEAIRAALVQRLENPAENVSKMASLLHSLAFDYDSDFTWLKKRISALKELTYAEFLEDAATFIGKENKRRLAIFVNGDLPSKGKIQYRVVADAAKIKSEIIYHSR